MIVEGRLVMSDRYPAEIHIGGSIPRTLLDQMFQKVIETGASLAGYDDGCATEDEVRAALRQGHTFDLWDCHASYGHFRELEAFLIQNGIHFNHHCEACYEYDAQNTYYRGGQVLTMAADQAGHPLLPVAEVLAILNKTRLGDHAKVEALRRLAEPTEAQPLDPIRFI